MTSFILVFRLRSDFTNSNLVPFAGSCARRIPKLSKSSKPNFSLPFKKFFRRMSSSSILTSFKVGEEAKINSE